MRMETFGELDCHVIDPRGGAPRLAVLLCHGFGACGDDLVPVAEALAASRPGIAEQVQFVLPEGPLALGDMGYGTARAWWMLDLQSVAARRAGDADALRRHRAEMPDGLPAARRLLRTALDALLLRSGLEIGQVVLGGFSQGAMLATDLALRIDEQPAALWALSGTLVAEPEWRRLAPLRAGLPVFQSHGTADPILPYASAEALRDLLREAGLAVEFLSFPGEHTIPEAAIRTLSAQLGALLART